MELLYIAQQLGMPMKEVAVNWKEIEGDPLTLHKHSQYSLCLRVESGVCVTISLVWLFWNFLFQDQNSSPSGAGPKWAGTSSSLGCGICSEYGNWIYPSQRPSDSTQPTHTTSHYAYMTVIRVLGSC